MARHRKRAWGPSNALWRWQHGRSSSSRSHRRARRGVSGMARRGRSRRSSGGGFLRGSGMLPGVAKNALAGWGAASVAEMLGFGGVLPGAVAGFVAAGPTGAVGGASKTLLKGVDIKGIGGTIAGNAIG
jgi:hypothetical protein